ncbi:hypothetical protein GCM10025868_06560 [Angustibacter aerolatus]|uniref:YggT family protein n=1 Tax=Angustibacter aerolatus TaxID=1162965 RepID=A0ABQ6JB40_9ACTN|nr:hypothetical protein GCM10025868_06560 [Angustibacter aerolatus]
MEVVRAILSWIVLIFFLLLIGRLVLDWVQMLAREWRPRGPLLVVAEVVYSVTDPPLRAIRKVVPPLRIGQIQARPRVLHPVPRRRAAAPGAGVGQADAPRRRLDVRPFRPTVRPAPHGAGRAAPPARSLPCPATPSSEVTRCR